MENKPTDAYLGTSIRSQLVQRFLSIGRRGPTRLFLVLLVIVILTNKYFTRISYWVQLVTTVSAITLLTLIIWLISQLLPTYPGILICILLCVVLALVLFLHWTNQHVSVIKNTYCCFVVSLVLVPVLSFSDTDQSSSYLPFGTTLQNTTRVVKKPVRMRTKYFDNLTTKLKASRLSSKPLLIGFNLNESIDCTKKRKISFTLKLKPSSYSYFLNKGQNYDR